MYKMSCNLSIVIITVILYRKFKHNFPWLDATPEAASFFHGDQIWRGVMSCMKAMSNAAYTQHQKGHSTHSFWQPRQSECDLDGSFYW